MGVEDIALLKLIEDCPKGCETLIIRVVHLLTERVATPNVELVHRVRELYANKVNDVRVLIPVLSGLTRQEVLNALPRLLKLNQIVVKEVFNRLLGIGADFANQTMAASPTDILVALHTMDPNTCDLKAIVKATSICLTEKDQVWRQKVIWEGFLKCCQRLKPQSLPVLLHLPQQQLVSALEQCPDLRQPLFEYAQSIQEEPMSGITPQLLDVISGKTVDLFIADESGGYITVDQIKKRLKIPPKLV
ncbi:unnamed protein product [Ceratitis capitata]|uniref:(Mediterranean fruit fly) hypothetical protein n=1 Tax=Ceratitis capitata TaxID=7213 RepID=A0A811TZY8_CERCA|nr:unnamed protein product [Ceratitis capitata]